MSGGWCVARETRDARADGARGDSSPAPRGSSLVIEGYASLWGVADLNRDVTVRGCFEQSLVGRGPAGVQMLHQHEDAPVGVWDEIYEDERGLFVRGQAGMGSVTTLVFRGEELREIVEWHNPV